MAPPASFSNTSALPNLITLEHHHHRQKPHRMGHKRTKSAGSSCTQDFGLYKATGLYAHQHRQKSFDDSYVKPLVNRFSASEINVSLVDNSYVLLPKDSKLSRLQEGYWLQLDNEANEEDDHGQKDCGIFSYRPKCLQKFATIQVFVFLSCLLVTLQQALSSGYFNSVITTIEKRFDIPSGVSGAVASTFELGNLLTVIFVSYFGSNQHIPVWLGTGVVVTGIGSLIFSVPHFMNINNPLENVNISGPLDDNICHIPTPALHSPYAERASHFINPLSPEADPALCHEGGTYRAPHIPIFMLAMVLIGCGGTPIFTLGTIYIDDHVRRESASMYMGCIYSMVAFGLVVGFLLGGYFISIHENSFGPGVIPADIYNGHPKWIGAWWAGFIVLGILLILIAIPFFAFPKSLKKKNNQKGDDEPHHSVHNSDFLRKDPKKVDEKKSPEVGFSASADGHRKKLRDIPSSMWKLLSNPVYIVTCLGSCMELCIVSGFLVFLPKYLETQFTIGKSQANLYAGGIAVPGACIGIFLGGYLLKRFQMKPKGAIQFVLFFNILCMGMYTALYFLGCDNIRMAGATHPYFNSSTPFEESFQVNLTAECNKGCGCSPNDIEPICGRNGITYFSPCHAGCKIAGGPRHIQNYSNCACIMESLSSQEVRAFPIATSGPCPQICQVMPLFLIILFIVTLVVSINQMPLITIILRSVHEDDRAFALGMQFVLFRLFAYIPSPIMFGNVIDSTCLLWKAHCGRQGGFCLMYNIEHFRLRYVGVCSALKVAAGLLFFIDWLLICWKSNKEFKESSLGVGERLSSMLSLDQLPVITGHPVGQPRGGQLEGVGDASPDSDYNSANDPDELQDTSELSSVTIRHPDPSSFPALSH